jgi:hypothetical protein
MLRHGHFKKLVPACSARQTRPLLCVIGQRCARSLAGISARCRASVPTTDKPPSTSARTAATRTETPTQQRNDFSDGSAARAFGMDVAGLVEIVEHAFENAGHVSLDTASLASMLRSSTSSGIMTDSVDLRRQVFGDNRLPAPHAVTIWELIWDALQARARRALTSCRLCSTRRTALGVGNSYFCSIFSLPPV